MANSEAIQHHISSALGGMKTSTGTPANKPISAAKHAEAASGKLGPKAAKQENFYRNVLKH